MQMLRTILEPLLEEVLQSNGIKSQHWKSMLVRSREHDQGDLSLPCFPFAKELGKSPIEIAEQLAKALPKHSALGEVNAVAGYLNIKANPHWLASQVMGQGVRIGDAYGKSPANDQHILIEHT